MLNSAFFVVPISFAVLIDQWFLTWELESIISTVCELIMINYE